MLKSLQETSWKYSSALWRKIIDKIMLNNLQMQIDIMIPLSIRFVKENHWLIAVGNS